MDVSAVNQAIADAVNDAVLTGNNLRVRATAAMPLYPEVPHFYCHSWRILYDRTFGGPEGTPSGLNELTGTWHLVLAFADDEAGFYEASRLSGSGESTIRAALLAARGGPGEDALGGAAEDVRLISASGPNLVDLGDAHYLAIEMPIWANGR